MAERRTRPALPVALLMALAASGAGCFELPQAPRLDAAAHVADAPRDGADPHPDAPALPEACQGADRDRLGCRPCGDAGSAQPCPFGCADGTCVEVVAVTVGYGHGCALGWRGDVYCWGDQSSGQLGNGVVAPLPARPVAVSGLPPIAQIEAGGQHTCALSRDGRVLCWGDNAAGQVGADLPAAVPRPHDRDLDGVVRLASAFDRAHCALTRGGEVLCWGLRLGQTWFGEDASPSPEPAPLLDLEGPPREVVVGRSAACARWDEGLVQCWGSDEWGQLGDGAGEGLVPGLALHSIEAPHDGFAAGEAHFLLTRAEGPPRAQCWGRNTMDQCGHTNLHDLFEAPVEVGHDPVAGYRRVTAGGGFSCGLRLDGRVDCWGGGVFGELGVAGETMTPWPRTVSGLEDVVDLAASRRHGCALTASGHVRCWGDDRLGQLGRGATGPSRNPHPTTVRLGP